MRLFRASEVGARRSLRSRIFHLGLTLLLALVFLILGLALFVVSQFRGTAELPADCAIVFGAAVHSAETSGGGINGAGPGILRRMNTAIDLYRRSLIKKMYLSGGKGEGMGLSEADVMEKLALKYGVRRSVIVKEGDSHSTWENLEKTRPLTTDCKSVVAISDRYHLARIRWFAWLQGWSELKTFPANEHAPWEFEVWNVFREMGGFVYPGNMSQTVN